MIERQQLIVPGTDITPRSTRAREMVQAVLDAYDRVKDPYASATKETYDRAGERYADFCDELGFTPWPLQPGQLIGFAEWYSRQTNRFGQPIAPSSVRTAMSALCSMDRWQRITPECPDPVSLAENIIVRTWAKKWAEDHPVAAQRQARVLERGELLAILEGIGIPTEHQLKSGGQGPAAAARLVRLTRDRALWCVGIGGALRMSDIIRLDVRDVERVERGLRLHIRKSKTDQLGEGQYRGIGYSATLALCPVRAWDLWLEARGTWAGPAFVTVQRSGALEGKPLTESGLRMTLERNAARVGIHVSTHTLRRTFGTWSRRKKRREEAIMRHADWKRTETARRYFQLEDIWDDNPTIGLFDD